MLSANSIAKPHLAMGSHYTTTPTTPPPTASQHRGGAASGDARYMRASVGGAAGTLAPTLDALPVYTSAPGSDATLATASAFALAASAAMSATTSSAVAALAAAALASAGTAPGSCGQAQTMGSADMAGGYGEGRGGWANNCSGGGGNNGLGDSRLGGSPLAAPRPVAAHSLGPPSWMLAALPLDVLLNLTLPNQKTNIINDVFFTPEERPQSPQLTPVSDFYDARIRALPPSDALESLDPSADLALFAAEPRSVWGSDEIDACSESTRQASPTPTVTSCDDCDSDSDNIILSTIAVTKCLHPSPLSAHVAQAKSPYARSDVSETASLSGDSCVDEAASGHGLVRESLRPTVFEELSHNGIDWCRYCGTTEGINWRPGPWGKRTLCNKHGCDYKGYGFASKMPRLNLKSFADEALEERIRPVLQTFCQICQQDSSGLDNILVHCDGCHRAYHQCCHPEGISDSEPSLCADAAPWYCESSCRDNARRRRIIVELPKCRLPYMCSPRHTAGSPSAAAAPPHPPTPAESLILRRGGLTSHTALHSVYVPAARLVAKTPRKRRLMAESPPPPPHSMRSAELKMLNLDAPADHASSAKVRKSSRVTRPSVKRLESDYTA